VISLRKLEELPPRIRARKLLGLLAETHDDVYDRGLAAMAMAILKEDSPPDPLSDRGRGLLRQRLSAWLGIETADWDLQAPPDRQGEVVRFPFSVYLEDLRSPFNVGSVVRTAEAYGFETVYHSPSAPGLAHPRARRSAMGADEYLEVRPVALAELKERWTDPVFALELGGTDVRGFTFPERGLVLVGGEELGLSPEALAWADSSAGRVSLPLYGRKASLNVGVAFGVLAAAWAGELPHTGGRRSAAGG
jgi:TrmH family RNA methyltransferase